MLSPDPDLVKPVVFPAGESATNEQLRHLLGSEAVVDHVSGDILDLFRLDFPYLAPESPEFQTTLDRYRARYPQTSPTIDNWGVWVHFPWRRTIVHLPSREDFFRLRTARNLFLIEPDEQARFYGSSVALAGLSVGSSVLHTLVLSGGPSNLHLADSDTLATVNLNRLHASVCDLGTRKLDLAARRAYELDPFLQILGWPEGLSPHTLERFLGGDRPVDLFIEEMDDLYMKIHSRLEARRREIPVVMATDNGDNVIVDVERFDLEPGRPLFHGSVNETALATIPTSPNLAERVRIAAQIVGPAITPRTQYAVQAVGTRIPTWPQLGNAATLSGAVVSYVARRILTGQSMPSGRYHVNLDALLDVDFDQPAAVAARNEAAEDFLLGLRQIFGVELR